MIGFETELSGRPFADAAAEVRAVCGRVERRPKGPIVASYDYIDEDGKTWAARLTEEVPAGTQKPIMILNGRSRLSRVRFLKGGVAPRLSSALSGTFTATRIVHCLATEFRAMLGGTVAARRQRPRITLAIV
jgi:hypothetical protein